MKIALLHHQIIRGTGVEVFLIEFAKRLAAAGHQLTCVSTLTTPEIGAMLPCEWKMLPRIRGSATLRMWHFDRLAPRAAREAGADVSIGFGRTCVQSIHRNGTGCHRLYGRLLPVWQRFSVKHLYELHLEKKLHATPYTPSLVTSSARVAAQLQGIYHTPAPRFHILSPPVETQIFKPSEDRPNLRELLCRKLQTDPSRPVLLFVSLSHRRRGLEPLLEAMQKLDATLWIAGKSLGPVAQGLIRGLGISGKVCHVPVTSQLIELYQAADWFIHPTQYDAFSPTVLQSMACGLPGVVSVMDGAVDHIQNGENGLMLYHPQQPVELAARIREALDLGETERVRLSRNARESVMPLTWEKHMTEWLELIEASRR